MSNTDEQKRITDSQAKPHDRTLHCFICKKEIKEGLVLLKFNGKTVPVHASHAGTEKGLHL